MANYILKVFMKIITILLLFIMTVTTPVSIQSQQICNGYAELCDRRYNAVAYAGTHNAATYSPSLVNNQDRTITQQLADGIRSMKIPVHFDTYNNQHTLMACHGIYRNVVYTNYLEGQLKKIPQNTIGKWITKGIKTVVNTPYQATLDFLKKRYGWSDSEAQKNAQFHPCIVDSSRQPFKNILQEIKSFLDRQRDAVVTLRIEDGTDDERVPTIIGKLFFETGLQNYAHVQDLYQPWPTLGDMVTNNKRLVIFLDSKAEFWFDKPAFKAAYPWLNRSRSFMWSYAYSYKDSFASYNDLKRDIDSSNYTLKNQDNFIASKNWPYNKIFTLGHQVSPGIGGGKSESSKVNRFELIKEALDKVVALSKSIPNIVDVDFYEVPNYDIIRAINYLNRVGEFSNLPPNPAIILHP